jgi:hypothetical protein
MPYAEENQSPKGQAYGTGAAQQRFQQATRPEATRAPQAAPTGTEPIDQPDSFTGDPDLDSALLSPTDRPQEPVTTFPGRVAPQSLAQTLRVLADATPSPDVMALADQAELLGL